MASQDHHTVASNNTHFDSEEKFRYELAKTVTLSPELYERLFISPKTPVAGDLRARFGTPTPIGVLGFSVGVIPLAISFSKSQLCNHCIDQANFKQWDGKALADLRSRQLRSTFGSAVCSSSLLVSASSSSVTHSP